MITKIIINGFGGQGVKYLAKKLSELLISKNYEVSLILSYDAAMEGGEIYAAITYSDKKIENPIIEHADILVELSKPKQPFSASKIISLQEIEKKFPGKRINEATLDFLITELKI